MQKKRGNQCQTENQFFFISFFRRFYFVSYKRSKVNVVTYLKAFVYNAIWINLLKYYVNCSKNEIDCYAEFVDS